MIGLDFTRFVMASVLLLSIVGGSVAFADTASATGCGTTVEYDAFLSDNSTVEDIQNNGSASISKKNTRVTVEETDAFVRVRADNPNGYCVRFVVRVSEDIVSPADVGTVSSTGDQYEATWEAVYDFDANQGHTKVVFGLSAGTQDVTFAPNKARVMSLAWTGDAKAKGSGLLSNLKGAFGGEQDLEKRTYEIVEGADSTVTIEMQSDEREIEDWQALYRTGNSEYRPIGTDTDDPVYYREKPDGDVAFTFNDAGRVEFTANPTTTERISHDWTSYWAPYKSSLRGLLGD